MNLKYATIKLGSIIQYLDICNNYFGRDYKDDNEEGDANDDEHKEDYFTLNS